MAGFSSICSRDAFDLGVDLVVGRRDLLLHDHRAQRQVGAHGLGGSDAHAGDELLLVLAGGGEVLRDRHAQALLLEPVREVVQAPLHLVVHERLGHLLGHERGGGLEDLLPHRHRGLHAGVHVEAGAHVVLQCLDGVELADLAHPFVGELGEHLLLRVLHQDLEGDLVAGALTEALGQRVVELQDVAGALAVQLLVELGHDDPRADLVEVVGGGEPLDRLVVDEALDVDLGVVAVGERCLAVGEVGEAVAQAVDLRA